VERIRREAEHEENKRKEAVEKAEKEERLKREAADREEKKRKEEAEKEARRMEQEAKRETKRIEEEAKKRRKEQEGGAKSKRSKTGAASGSEQHAAHDAASIGNELLSGLSNPIAGLPSRASQVAFGAQGPYDFAELPPPSYQFEEIWSLKLAGY
jgi:hypothetical protein